MDNEEPFAIEAQEETTYSRNRPQKWQKSDTRVEAHEDDLSDTETSPLVSHGDAGPRHRLSHAGRSYGRAILRPWTGAQGSADLPWYKKPSLLWLLIPFFPFCLAFGGLLVPRTYLILNLICEEYLSDRAAKDPGFHFLPVLFGDENPQCRDPAVQSLTAKFQLYMNLCTGILSAIVTPHLGALSDRIGRTKVIVIASFGSFLSEIIFIWVGTHPGEVSVYWILLGCLCDGMSGSFTSAMAVAFAFASDCSSPDRRNVAFGYFHGTLFAGIALGPILAGYIIKATDNIMVCFYIALGCHTFFILFIFFIAPESLSKERQILAREKFQKQKEALQDNSWITTIKNYNLFEPLWVLRPKGPGSSSKLRKNLVLLAAIDTTMFGVAMGTMGIIIIYAEFKFGWSAFDSSMFLSAVNICRVIALVVVLPLLTRLVRGRGTGPSSFGRGPDMLDINIIRGAIVFDVLGYIGYALVPTGGLLILSGTIASFGGMASPSLASSLTKSVPSDRTGQMLGASGLLHALSRVVAPTVFNLIYSATVAKFAGAVFFCLGSVFVVAFIMSWFLRPNVYFDESLTSSSDEQVGDPGQ